MKMVIELEMDNAAYTVETEQGEAIPDLASGHAAAATLKQLICNISNLNLKIGQKFFGRDINGNKTLVARVVE